MSSSLRVRRMARNHRRRSAQPRLNLVALMDIFTILVLFLMVNNGDVEVLQADSELSLPESISEQRPELALTIKISDSDISVQGRPVETIATALNSPGPVLPGLAQALRRQAELEPGLTEQQQSSGRAVIIMGDQQMPYKLLKRILATCAQGDYRDISLAVDSNPPAPITAQQLQSAQIAMGGA